MSEIDNPDLIFYINACLAQLVRAPDCYRMIHWDESRRNGKIQRELKLFEATSACLIRGSQVQVLQQAPNWGISLTG